MDHTPEAPLPTDTPAARWPSLAGDRAPGRALFTSRSAWAVLALALVLRLAWGLAVPVIPDSDPAAYDTFARQIASGGTYGWTPGEKSAVWPPGTSAIYALAYRAMGPGAPAVVLVNVVAGMGVVLVSMLLADRLLGRRAALLTGLLLAAWPVHVQFTTIIASEIHFTLFTLGGALSYLALRDRFWLNIVVSGVVFAIAAYIRPTALLVPVVLAGLDFLWNARRGRTFVMAALLGLVIAACLAPWSVRNTRHFGQFVAISTNGGANLWMGNNPSTTGFYQPWPDPAGRNEAQLNADMGREARDYILKEPVKFLTRTLYKLARLHERQTIGVGWNEQGLTKIAGAKALTPLKALSTLYWLGAAALGAIGVVVLAARGGVLAAGCHPLVVLWAYFAIVHAVIVIQDRYIYPATPVIGALAAVTLLAALDRFATRRGASSPRPAA